jgi:hypothetical protein
MNGSFSTAGLKALFRYPMQGKEWGRKLLYLALFYLGGFIIPIVPWLFSCGYFAAILRQIAEGDSSGDLPEWQDWNRLLMDGLRMFAGGLILALPVVLLFTLGFSFYFGTFFAGIGASESGRDGLMGVLFSIGMPVLFCTMAFGILLSIGLHLASGPALTHMAVKGSFGALFQVKEWWQILRANLGGYLIVIFLIYAIGYAIQMLISVTISTLVLMCITPLLLLAVAPYFTVITAVLFGQAYREGVAALAVVVEPAGDEPQPDPAI